MYGPADAYMDDISPDVMVNNINRIFKEIDGINLIPHDKCIGSDEWRFSHRLGGVVVSDGHGGVENIKADHLLRPEFVEEMTGLYNKVTSVALEYKTIRDKIQLAQSAYKQFMTNIGRTDINYKFLYALVTPGIHIEKKPGVPYFYSKDGKIMRELDGVVVSGRLVNFDFIPDEL